MGPNAIGKTSVIEALALASTGDSFRAGKIEEMIAFEQELGRVTVTIEDEDESGGGVSADSSTLEVLLTRGEVQGRKTQRRLFSINGARKQKRKFVGQFHSVVFRPEDLRLVEGSPGRRRTFLDTPLSTLFPTYASSLKTYEQTLKRRNKLLQQIREGETSATTLSYWNMSLIKHGEAVQERRRQFVGSFDGVQFPVAFSLEYQPSIISQERIDHYQSREIAAGHTLVGPHKDDFEVRLLLGGERRSIAEYGSRGQQRLAVLWLKMCELEYVASEVGERPVLLLDDILSELDETSQSYVLDMLKQGQSIVTSADKETKNAIATQKVIEL